MASLLELGISTGKWDAGLRKAQSSLNSFIQAQGGLQQAIDKENTKIGQFVRMMGDVESSAKTAKGQMKDYKGTLEQLTMQYNQLTDAQKKTVGPDYMAAIDKLKAKFRDAKSQVEEFNRSIKDIDSSKLSVDGGGLFGGGKLNGMLQVFGGNLMTKIAGFGASFAMEIGDAVKQSAELARQAEGIEIAFGRLNRPGLLDQLNEATHGTVSNLELMKAAIKFENFKLPLEDLGTYLAFAQQKAKDTGESIDYLVTSIVNGLGRQSVQILDNLGISAGEIRKRMKEGGDMTKVVADIIREEMAKAGDYIETASDRAAKADKELQDAMLDLGKTFQPVEQAGASMWNSLKVGALNLLNNVLKPLINAFSTLGQMREMYDNQGGDERVNRMLDRLKNIGTDNYRQGTYKAQLKEFDSKISSYQQYLSDYKAWEDSKRHNDPNISAYERMKAFRSQTGLSFFSDVKAQLGVFQQMRQQYVAGAKAILKKIPVPDPFTTTTTTTGDTGSNKPTYAADSLAAQQAEVQRLTTLWREASADMRSGYLADLVEAEKILKKMQDEQTLLKENLYGRLLGGNVDLKNLSITGMISYNPSSVTSVGEGLTSLPEQPKVEVKQIEKQVDAMQQLSKGLSGLSSVMSGLQAVGFEIPDEVQKAIAVIQGAISVMQGVETIISVFSTSAENANTIALGLNTAAIYSLEAAMWANTGTNIIPGFHNGGVVHAATGLVVPGNSYSGDNIPALLDSGETVLTHSQTANLAAELETSGINGLHIVGELEGEKIILVANRTYKRKGEGEIVTWKN